MHLPLILECTKMLPKSIETTEMYVNPTKYTKMHRKAVVLDTEMHRNAV